MSKLKLTLAMPGLLFATSALADVPNWTMSEASGHVTVASSGMVRAASRGATLSAGDVIATGAKGRAVLVRGQEYLVVAPNSRIRVADPVKSGGMTQIIEQIGNVVFKIKKMATPHFAVETPFLAAVVKGTTFSVTVTEAGASVQVVEGRVEVETRDGGARYLVLPGDIGSVSAKALGRLNVQGRETRTIISPAEGGRAMEPTAQILQADPSPVVELPADPVIAVAISEPPVRLVSATDGMVSGALLAVVALTPERRTAFVEATPIVETPPTPVSRPEGASDSAASDGQGSNTGNGVNGTPAGANGNSANSAPAGDNGNGTNSSGNGNSGSANPGQGNGNGSGNGDDDGANTDKGNGNGSGNENSDSANIDRGNENGSEKGNSNSANAANGKSSGSGDEISVSANLNASNGAGIKLGLGIGSSLGEIPVDNSSNVVVGTGKNGTGRPK